MGRDFTATREESLANHMNQISQQDATNALKATEGKSDAEVISLARNTLDLNLNSGTSAETRTEICEMLKTRSIEKGVIKERTLTVSEAMRELSQVRAVPIQWGEEKKKKIWRYFWF